MIDAGALVFVALVAPLTAWLSWRLTGRLRTRLLARGVLDRPNERSSHAVPTPRGGGLAIVGLAVPGSVVAATLAGAPMLPVGLLGLAALALVAVSLIDDVRSVAAGYRFVIQIVAVAAGIAALHEAGASRIPDHLLVPTVAAAAIAWLWFVNLYNFMDGIDGISVVETLSICLGIALVDLLQPALSGSGPGGQSSPWLWAPAVIIGAATAGFAPWNWSPARIFMGDVGSITLGYLLCGMLLLLALKGQWAAALILPGYYLADATLTIARRMLRGRKPWRAHKEHFYQRAVQAHASHRAVSVRIGICNLLLIGCSLLAASGRSLAGLVLAAVCVAMLLVSFGRPSR